MVCSHQATGKTNPAVSLICCTIPSLETGGAAMSFRILFRVLAVFGSLMLVPAATLAQELYCPDGYPVDCGTGSCCPAGNYCLPEGGCAPVGWSSCGGGTICPPGTNLYCPRSQTCYNTYDGAASGGCSFQETIVCGSPVQ
jgi:hypothetical protein